MSPRPVLLDPTAPYLADHRPNGRPLLGTVASLEILAEAASPLLGGAPGQIAAVEIASPLTFTTDESRTVHADCRESDSGTVGCSLESETARHLSCHFLGTSMGSAPRRPPLSPGPRAIGRSEIYRLFFHGPAFQVVVAAEWREGTLITRLNKALPPWHVDGRPTLTAPRLLEFALQSAGLLALAEQPVMAIPRHIARIERFLPADERALPVLFAAAARENDDIGIDLFDAEGRVHLRVEGYRTAALPYPVGRDRMDALHRALRR
jgi:hypothetical protein